MSIELETITLEPIELTAIGLSPISGDARAALIAALFGAGEAGALYDPSDAATCFQERTGAAATTPAGANDPVGTILDVSGNGNHATAPSDAARPLRKTAGGLWWLATDGIDDALSFTTNVPSSALHMSFGIGLVNTSGVTAFELSASNRADSLYAIGYAATMNAIFRNAGFSVTGGLATNTVGFVVGQQYVITSTANGSALRNRQDGAQIGSSDAGTWPSNPPLTKGYIGANTINTQPQATLFSGAVIRAAASSAAEITQAEEWLASKAGVTL